MGQSWHFLAGTHALAATLLLVSACTGEIGTSAPGTKSRLAGPVGGAVSPGATSELTCTHPGELQAGLTRLRRLTRDELDNTLRDLLAVADSPSSTISPDEKIGPFYSNAVAPITDLVVQQFQELAARVAVDAASRLKTLSPCDLVADSGTTCASQFIEQFGLRAYRRSLDASEVAKLLSLYTLGRGNGGATNGFRLVVEAILQAPSFLYHADIGVSGGPTSVPEAIDAYSLASRLSYFLWNTMPDDELFAAAKNGSILTESVLASEGDRLLEDPRAGATLALFHRQWLGIGDLGDLVKDPTMFPQWSPDLAAAMLRETGAFAQNVVLRGDGLLSTLLTANFTYVDRSLLDIYGIGNPGGFVAGGRVTLDPGTRAGILTQPAFLAKWSHNNQTSPVHRGILVRENLLCQPISPPPPNVNAAPPPVSAATSTRERFAQHEASPICGGCHKLFDPIGLGFEHYDAIGAYRTTDGLGPVDATGEVKEAGADLSGTFNGAIELTSKLAQADEVASCLTKQWFRFALGRTESQDDACSMQTISENFKKSGGNIRALLAEVSQSNAFRAVRLDAGQEKP